MRQHHVNIGQGGVKPRVELLVGCAGMAGLCPHGSVRLVDHYVGIFPLLFLCVIKVHGCTKNFAVFRQQAKLEGGFISIKRKRRRRELEPRRAFDIIKSPVAEGNFLLPDYRGEELSPACPLDPPYLKHIDKIGIKQQGQAYHNRLEPEIAQVNTLKTLPFPQEFGAMEVNGFPGEKEIFSQDVRVGEVRGKDVVFPPLS